MVQVIRGGPTRTGLLAETLGQALGTGLGEFSGQYFANKSLEKVLNDPGLKDAPLSERQSRLESALRPYGERGRNLLQSRLGIEQQRNLETAIKKSKEVSANPNAKPSDILFSLLESGMPEKAIGPAFQSLMQEMQLERSYNKDYSLSKAQQTKNPLENVQEINQNQISQPKRTNEITSFDKNLQKIQENKFFPSVKGENSFPGSLPQQETTGVKKYILDGDEEAQVGAEIAKDLRITVPEGINIARSINEGNKLKNQQIDKELEQKITAQEKYGALAEQKLLKLFPKATDEQISYFKRKGEKAASKSESQANIEREMSGEARKFKNMLSSVEKDLPAARSYNAPINKILGSEKEFEQARKDLRIKLKPLLDAGLYDTARNLMSKLGYYPEETESVLSSLNDTTMKYLTELPKMTEDAKQIVPRLGSIGYKRAPETYSEGQISMIENNLKKVLKTDPAANLILLRREYEKKNVDWRAFKDALNNLIINNEIRPNEEDQLNDDQFNQLKYLDKPPLNNAEKILKGLKLIGS